MLKPCFALNYQNSSCKWKTLFLLSMRQLTTSWPTILFLLLFLCGQVFVDVVLRQGQGVVHFASHNLSVSRFHGLWDHSHSHVFHGFNSVCSHLHNFFHLYTKSQSRTFIDIIFKICCWWILVNTTANIQYTGIHNCQVHSLFIFILTDIFVFDSGSVCLLTVPVPFPGCTCRNRTASLHSRSPRPALGPLDKPPSHHSPAV